MSTTTSTASGRAQQEEGLADLAACWPQFSAAEARRLRFLGYRRATTGRRHPDVPPLWRACLAAHGSAPHAHRLWEASA